MKDLYWLYSIENKIDGKKYIGWTVNPNNRWKQHIKSAANDKPKQYVHKAMKSHGVSNFWFGCVEFYFTEADALIREKELIKLFKTNNSQYGYNLTEGGEGATGYKHTEETKSRLAALAKQKVGPLNPFFGKKHTPEVISLSAGENNKQAKLTTQKVIELLDLYYTGNFTEEDLSKIFAVKRQTVNDILRGKRWKHIERNIKKIDEAKLSHRRKQCKI